MNFKKKTLGLILIIGPWILLPLTLAGYAVASFVFPLNEDYLFVGEAVNLLLSVLGIVAVLGMIIGLPLGIFFLFRNK